MQLLLVLVLLLLLLLLLLLIDLMQDKLTPRGIGIGCRVRSRSGRQSW